MRKMILAFSLAATLAAALVVTGGRIASAEPGNGNGATIDRNYGCYLDWAGIIAYTDDQTIEVTTPAGNTMLRCNFRPGETTGPPWTVRLEGFTCYTAGGVTHDSLFVVNKEGNALLQCKLKANS